MKKNILTLIAIITVFSACKKDNNNNPGNSTGDYQPTTAGSAWTYQNEASVIDDVNADPDITTVVNTMTGTTKVFNGKTFHVINTVDDGSTAENYFGINGHIYTSRSADDDGAVEIDYLDDSKDAGYSSITNLQIQGADARLKTTVVEKGITKTILNKAYSSVIHTKLETQVKDGANYTTTAAVDFYVAKGVGIIAIYTSINNIQLSKSELKSYVIK
ncbi:MAG: hypothetical protein WC615_08795 [Mucilaginibacter sp.]|jgi:hypothetical protein|uniref:hypothetical protein n=1 Tax=Mucilaginibacter sp. TaxID=1882438 RepID=UPI00356874D0